MAKDESLEEQKNTMNIDGETVELRNKNSFTHDSKKEKRKNLRNSIRDSFRNNAWRRSLIRRIKSCEPKKG